MNINYKELSNDEDWNVRKTVASDPNCPIEIIIKLSNDEDSDVRLSVARNIKTPVALFEYMLEYDLIGFTWERGDSFFKTVNAKILDKKCPIEFIYYIYKYYLDKYTNYEYYISDEALEIIYNVINDINKNGLSINEACFFKGIFPKKDYPSNNLDLSVFNNGLEYISDNSNRSDFSKKLDNNQGVKIVMSCDKKRYIENTLRKFNTNRLAFGSYPQRKLTKLEVWSLNNLEAEKMLHETGKEYGIMNSYGFTRRYKEYTFDDCRFVKFGKEWYQVEPVFWIYDSDKKCFVTESSLLGLRQIMYYEDEMLNKCFIKDIVEDTNSLNIVNPLEVKESIKEETLEEAEKQKEIDKITTDNKIREMQKKEIERQETIKKLEKERLDLLKQLKSISEMRESLEPTIYDKINAERIGMNLDYLLKKVDDHYEFVQEYIPYLKYIDLSYVGFIPNLKCSGIDFSDTNISIDPQTVFNKDLSYSKFNDDNIRFKSFEGCKLFGTDISDDKNSIGFDKALTNQSTKLPRRK